MAGRSVVEVETRSGREADESLHAVSVCETCSSVRDKQAHASGQRAGRLDARLAVLVVLVVLALLAVSVISRGMERQRS